MAIKDDREVADGEVAAGAGAAEGAASGVRVPPEADAVVLLRQKGVVGSLRVATRALAQHGLRRERQFQHTPSRED